MRSGLVVCLALGAVVLDDANLQAQRRGRFGRGPRGGLDGWIFSLESGKAEARRTGKPLMVVLRCAP
jgi:hypothetical protein